MMLTPFRRTIRSANRRFREARLVARALASPHRPVIAHVIPIRRCNLACSYCNEYDAVSEPVPTSEMLRRIDRLAELGTLSVTLSGGEPLLHPDVEAIIRRIRSRDMTAGLITNGYLLSEERIGGLNRAGLDHLQISVDNATPDEVSKKSLKVLDAKLRRLAGHAEFLVNVNSVLGSGVRNPEDAVAVARRALALGFSSTVGILHDGSGQLRPLDDRRQRVYGELDQLPKPFVTTALYNRFQRNLTRGMPNDWHCRAGCRYLYVCEDGLVHYCSQQRGYPGIPLEQYGPELLAREYESVKTCASFCTISCVHRVAMIDEVRERPREALSRFFPSGAPDDRIPTMPPAVRVLAWLFVPTGSGRRDTVLRRLARSVLRA
jgi:MoaA/NifB/PqqE/SkfB family radical SAM enzyme